MELDITAIERELHMHVKLIFCGSTKNVFSRTEILNMTVDDAVRLGGCWKGAWDACVLISGCTLDVHLRGFAGFEEKRQEVLRLCSGINIGMSLLIF